MKPLIKVTYLNKVRCYICFGDTWKGWGMTPTDAYNDYMSWAFYGGTCA